MAMEATAQAKLRVSAERLWKAMAKDYLVVIPKIMTDFVEKIEIIEGDGGVGSVLFFQLGSRARTMKTVKEKIMELDEATYTFGTEVIEGAMLKKEYSSFKTSFKLTPKGEGETLVDVKVVFGFDGDGDDDHRLHLKENITKPALEFVIGLEKYILQNSLFFPVFFILFSLSWIVCSLVYWF